MSLLPGDLAKTEKWIMSLMERKQIYIKKHQQAQLKRLAQARGVSEAEVIRQAIDREVQEEPIKPMPTDHDAWEEILRFVEARKALEPTGKPYKWNREDAYEERMRKFDHFGKPKE
jgi:hypothetical protein